MKNQEDFKVRGEIEVILEDENGNVKHREVHHNAITRPVLCQMLSSVLNTTGIQAVTKFNTRSDYTAANPCGIFLLSEDIHITKDTHIPPHLNIIGGYNDKIVFKNVNGETVENEDTMLLIPQKVGMNINGEIRYTVEYVKNTFKGTFKSIFIGPSNNYALRWYCGSKDTEFPDLTFDAEYLIKHTTNGTVIYKKKSDNSELYTLNLKTKEMETFTASTVPMANIAKMHGAVVLGDLPVMVNRTGLNAAKNSHVLTFYTYPSWRTEATNPATTVTFETPVVEAGENETCAYYNNGVIPVVVPRPDLGDNVLEVFVPTHIKNAGKADARWVIQKITATVNAPDDIEFEAEVFAELPYRISCYNFNNIHYQVTGMYHDGKYYLPYYNVMNPVTGAEVTLGSQDAQEGIIVDAETKAVLEGFTQYIGRTNNLWLWVESDDFRQMRLNNADIRYGMFTRAFSGTNLDAPVEKGHNDTLRVRYSYVIA